MNKTIQTKEARKGFAKRNMENPSDLLDTRLTQEAKEFVSGAKPRFSEITETASSKQYQPRAPRKIPFNLRMDVNLREIVEKIAEAEDRSLHWVTEQILKEGIRKRAEAHGIKLNF